MTAKLPFRFMNAAGWAKTLEQVKRLAKVPYLTHIVVGSFTKEARDGNTGGTNFWVDDDGTSVNALGLPNKGMAYLKMYGKEMVQIAKDSGKLLVISIAGFSPREYGELAELAANIGAIIEVNVGCPNVHDGGHQKEIISYDFALLGSTLQYVLEAVAGHPLWIKPSPYANPADRVRFANLIRPHQQHIHAVVGANTFPNVSMYHGVDSGGKPFIDVVNNYAGFAGTAIKWINLSQCRHYAELLPDVPTIGVGGIKTGGDVHDYLTHAACLGVQVGTAFFKDEDPSVFQDIVESLPESILPISA